MTLDGRCFFHCFLSDIGGAAISGHSSRVRTCWDAETIYRGSDLSFGQRDDKGKGAAFSDLAVHPDPTAMALDQFFGDG